MKTPDLSFVIPVHNGEAWVSEAIESCTLQSHKNIQIVVVNDGSTDDTLKVINYWTARDSRVKLVNLGSNMGRGHARNKGYEYATAPIIAVLDADDIADTERAKITLKAMKGKGEVYFHGGAAILDSSCNKMHDDQIPTDFDLKEALKTKYNKIVHSTAAFPKSLTEKFKHPEDEYGHIGLDDWHMQIRVAMAGIPIIHTKKVITAYRGLKGGISKVRDRKETEALKVKFMEAQSVSA